MSTPTQNPRDAYTEAKATTAPARTRNAAGKTTWFNWTQYPDHGPDDGLLRIVSARALDAARDRWGDVDRLQLHRADAAHFLTANTHLYDAVFSVFGAVWFNDPEELLPLVAARLAPGGVPAFSQEPPIDGCYGCQGAYVRPADGGKALPLRRWAFSPSMWHGILTRLGFTGVRPKYCLPLPPTVWARSSSAPSAADPTPTKCRRWPTPATPGTPSNLVVTSQASVQGRAARVRTPTTPSSS